MTQIEKLWEVFRANKNALLANDVDALKRIYAEDFRSYNLKGETEKRDLIFDAYAPGQVRLSAYETHEVTAEVLGDVGIIAGRGFISGRFRDRSFEHRLHFLDILVWRGDRWLYYVSHSTALDK